MAKCVNINISIYKVIHMVLILKDKFKKLQNVLFSFQYRSLLEKNQSERRTVARYLTPILKTW